MGDFNADMERYIAKNKLATRGKYRISQMLLDKGLYDTQKLRVLTTFIIHGLEMTKNRLYLDFRRVNSRPYRYKSQSK